MGTNFFRYRVPTREERGALHRELDELLDKPNMPVLSFTGKIDNRRESVHICKMSVGWQVCFDHNWGEYYKPCRADLEKFLSEPNTIIIDDNGDTYTPEQFWEEVKAHNSNSRNILTAKVDNLNRKARGLSPERPCSSAIAMCKEILNIDSYGEDDFAVDGLRFAVYSTFR